LKRQYELLKKVRDNYKGKTVIFFGSSIQMSAMRVALRARPIEEENKEGMKVIQWQKMRLHNGEIMDMSSVLEEDNKNGGIDLDPEKMNIVTKSSGESIQFNLDPAMLQRLQNSSGVTPVIVSVHALDSLQQFMGVSPVI
jgi:hypothetical protein